jgi:hypothetical protein
MERNLEESFYIFELLTSSLETGKYFKRRQVRD